LLAPITPFITDYIWIELYSKSSIHTCKFPRAAWSKAHKRYTEPMLAFNREVWKMKEEKNLALRDPLELRVPEELAPFRADLIKMHSLTTNP
jgi:valyl-tRNA synthetase